MSVPRMREGVKERAVDRARDIKLESKGYQDGNQKTIQKYAYFSFWESKPVATMIYLAERVC